MIKTVVSGAKSGTVNAPSSKSQMHRLLIYAALGSEQVNIGFDGLSEDISATADCLRALGAKIEPAGPSRLSVRPIETPPSGVCQLYCGESGSTLRFLLPIAGALGVNARFHMWGRLPQRPLQPLAGILAQHGMQIQKEGDTLVCCGRLRSGSYSILGNVSSQYISGLLMALPLLPGDSELAVEGPVESKAYIAMTEQVLRQSGIRFSKSENRYQICGGQKPSLPKTLTAEGDWSGAAAFLCMGALSQNGITVTGLDPFSLQGDREVLEILRRFGAIVSVRGNGITVKKGELAGTDIDARAIPDLIPVLSAVAAAAKGESRVINAARLRLKESDRLSTTCSVLSALGANIEELTDGLRIKGVPQLMGGTVSSFSDHRIAMAAAVAASAATAEIAVEGSECVGKSFPHFWQLLDSISGGAK